MTQNRLEVENLYLTGIETFMVEYDYLNDLRAVESKLIICPIGAHSDYQSGIVTGMTLDASVDMVYTPRKDN